MRISCPKCSATYDVPAELAAGRPVVRCVQCTEQWKLGQPASQSASRPQRAVPTPAEPRLAPIPDAVLGRIPAPEPDPMLAPIAETGAGLQGDALLMERPPAVALPDEVSAAPAPRPADAGRAAEPIVAAMADTTSRPEVPSEARDEVHAPAMPSAKPAHEDGPSAVRLVLASIAGNLFAAAGWAFSLGIVLALGWMAIYHRSGIMHAWPPSQRLFTWLGLA